MKPLDYPEASFASGIQNLMATIALAQIAANSQTIAPSLDAESSIPRRVVVVGAHHAGHMQALCRETKRSRSCVGLIFWMRTL
jgi:L-arabinose isomerase